MALSSDSIIHKECLTSRFEISDIRSHKPLNVESKCTLRWLHHSQRSDWVRHSFLLKSMFCVSNVGIAAQQLKALVRCVRANFKQDMYAPFPWLVCVCHPLRFSCLPAQSQILVCTPPQMPILSMRLSDTIQQQFYAL